MSISIANTPASYSAGAAQSKQQATGIKFSGAQSDSVTFGKSAAPKNQFGGFIGHIGGFIGQAWGFVGGLIGGASNLILGHLPFVGSWMNGLVHGALKLLRLA